MCASVAREDQTQLPATVFTDDRRSVFHSTLFSASDNRFSISEFMQRASNENKKKKPLFV